MTATEIAARLLAKPAGARKWMARCPAHHDRHASLSIGGGREGRVLLRCFAGCSIGRVMAALRLQLHDLFERGQHRPWRPRYRAKPATRETIIMALDSLAASVQNALHERGIDGELLTHEINAIRKCVASELSVTLAPLPIPLYEGGYGGRERDPQWAHILEYAWWTTCIERLAFPSLSLGEHARTGARPMRTIFVDAEERAARMLSEIANENRANV
jgi:hypothetical protein